MGIATAPSDEWLLKAGPAYWSAWFAKIMALGGTWNCNTKPSEREQKMDDELIKRLRSDYMQAPSGFLGRMRVSLVSVINALGGLNDMSHTALESNIGCDEYVMSGILMYLECLCNAGAVRVAWALASIRLSDLGPDGLGELEVISKHGSRVYGCGHGSHWITVRSKTLLGRDLRPADKDAEVEQRTTVRDMLCFPNHLGGYSGYWRFMREKLTEMLANAGGYGMRTEQNIQTWWDARLTWLPGGSASTKSDVGKKLKVQSGAREAPSKAVELGNIGSETAMEWFNETPCIVARLSTKNEPGLKRRALRASDDRSYSIAAYASAGTEKCEYGHGAVIRQTPVDVVETHKAIMNAPRGRYNLCADYADFNLAHSTYGRSLLSCCFAKVFASRQMNRRAYAAAWMSLAHGNHQTENGEWIRQGLSSGERDTARDNTLLHVGYMEAAALEADQCAGISGRPQLSRVCGDDEALIGGDWYWLHCYYTALQLQGHELQGRKVSLTNEWVEFLQYNFSRKMELPRQPPAPAIVNFVSGSWYKRSAYLKHQVPNEVADAAASLWRRGMPLHVCRKLAISCCNWLCTGVAWRNMLNGTLLFANHRMEAVEVNIKEQMTEQGWSCPRLMSANDYASLLKGKYNLPDDVLHSVWNMNDNLFVKYGLASGKYVIAGPQNDADRVVQEWDDNDDAEVSKAIKAIMNGSHERMDDAEQMMCLQLGIPVSVIKQIGLTQLMNCLPNTLRGVINVGVRTDTLVNIPARIMCMMPGAYAAMCKVSK